jgi:nitric oxide reductase activation protein
MGEAMMGLGDPFAIRAFCSNARQEVRYYHIKDFEAPYCQRSKSRLAGLRGGLSTRIGAALRHAGHELAQQQTFRRLLLIVTDGEPSDTDVSDRRYLVEDARKAVQSLAHEGIDVLCVGLDSGGDSYLTRIFGRRNVVQIDNVAALPEKLPMLYLRLTA